MNGPDAAGSRSPDDIQREIEQTRERMTRDIDEISGRLSPTHLKARAQTRIEDAKEAVVDKVRDVAENAGDQAKRAGRTVVDAIRHNPLPALIVGGGLGYLLMRSRREAQPELAESPTGLARRYDYRSPVDELPAGVSERRAGTERRRGGRLGHLVDTVKEQGGELAGQAGSSARQLRSRARGQAQRAVGKTQGLFENNPLIVGAGVLVLGAAIGSLIPETAQENRFMGGTRDQLMGRAKEKVQQVKEVAKETAREVKDRVTEDAQDTARREAEQRNLKS